jgi:hypothetical protein
MSEDIRNRLLVPRLRLLPDRRSETMPLGRDAEHVARDLQPVSVEFQTTPYRKVKVSVKYAPNRWEIEAMMQAPSTKKWHVITGPVVSYKAVEVSKILKELLAEAPIEFVALDVYGGDRALQYFSPPTLDAVAQHVAEAGVEWRGLDIEEAYALGIMVLGIARMMSEAIVTMFAAVSKPWNYLSLG